MCVLVSVCWLLRTVLDLYFTFMNKTSIVLAYILNLFTPCFVFGSLPTQLNVWRNQHVTVFYLFIFFRFLGITVHHISSIPLRFAATERHSQSPKKKWGDGEQEKTVMRLRERRGSGCVISI